MKQKTLDLLDSELRNHHARYTGTPPADRELFFTLRFRADPTQWANHAAYLQGQTLVWNEFRYSDIATSNDLRARITSSAPGLYVFYARPNLLVEQFPQFALYIGISNDRDSGRPLRDRLNDYFYIHVVEKRDNVFKMLQLFYPDLWVKYTLLDWTTRQLKELETSLHEYLGVPFSTQAYRPESKAASAAWGR